MKYPETARRLSYILNLRDMTAQELSNRSGVGKSSISHYINGNNEPHSHNAGKMAKVLNVDPQWLMGFDVPMEEHPFIEKLLNGKLEPDNMINQTLVISLDDIYRDLTYEQVNLVRLFAQFLREKKVGISKIKGFDPSIFENKKEGES